MKNMQLINTFGYYTVCIAFTCCFGCARQEQVCTAEHINRAIGVVKNEDKMLECTGTLHPLEIFTLRLNAGEVVESVHVKTGDIVKPGDLLATLFNPILKGELVAAHERILQLRRDLTQVNSLRWNREIAVARQAELVKQLGLQESLRGKVEGYDPQTQARKLIEEKTQIEREIQRLDKEITLTLQLQEPVKALINVLEQRISELEQSISRLTVRAPHAGLVVRVERDPASKNGLLLEVHDRTKFIVQGTLWQNQLANVKSGSDVVVIPDFILDTQWKGTVSAIGFAPLVGAATSFPQYSLYVVLAEQADTELLRDGMTVFMQIHPLKKAP